MKKINFTTAELVMLCRAVVYNPEIRAAVSSDEFEVFISSPQDIQIKPVKQ